VQPKAAYNIHLSLDCGRAILSFCKSVIEVRNSWEL